MVTIRSTSAVSAGGMASAEPDGLTEARCQLTLPVTPRRAPRIRAIAGVLHNADGLIMVPSPVANDGIDGAPLPW
jgi:hypothetical protein